MPLPSREDINVHDSLDEQSACEHFLGKTLEQAEALFRENSLYYQEDLMWMGPAAFQFYVQADNSYIQSAASANDSAIVNGLTSTLEFRLKHEPGELEPIVDKLAAICDYMIQNYTKFDMTPEIFGDVRSRLEELKRAFQSLAPNKGA